MLGESVESEEKSAEESSYGHIMSHMRIPILV